MPHFEYRPLLLTSLKEEISSLHMQFLGLQSLANGVSFLSCSCCGSVPEKGQPSFKCCSSCRRSRYCSTECQRRDWTSGHSQQCALFKAFWEWQNGSELDVSKLPRKGPLVWFDDGSCDAEHWMMPTLAEELKLKPRLHRRIVYPAMAISICSTGCDADWAWVVANAAHIGLDPGRIAMMGSMRRSDAMVEIDEWPDHPDE
jgi:hypothetical protein